MGALKDIVSLMKGKKIDDPKLIQEIEKVGQGDAEKIAERMGQTTKKEISPKVDVSNLPPIEMPKQRKQEEHEKEDEGR